jgi:hypothetical protein
MVSLISGAGDRLGGAAHALHQEGRPDGGGEDHAQGAAAVASCLAAALTEIYLCNVCSCQERLRRNGRGQDITSNLAADLQLEPAGGGAAAPPALPVVTTGWEDSPRALTGGRGGGGGGGAAARSQHRLPSDGGGGPEAATGRSPPPPPSSPPEAAAPADLGRQVCVQNISPAVTAGGQDAAEGGSRARQVQEWLSRQLSECGEVERLHKLQSAKSECGAADDWGLLMTVVMTVANARVDDRWVAGRGGGRLAH